MTMKSPDLFSSLFWMVLAVCLILWGYGLELGTLSEPDSGFIIFWAGILMFGLSMAVLLIALREKDRQAKRNPLWSGSGWRKVIWVTAALALYAFLLRPLGFLVGTFLFLLFLFRIYEPQKWLTTIWVSALMVIVTYLVFDVWLGSQLPNGFLDLSWR
jgi:putative tricarboxylic transport membrane protein